MALSQRYHDVVSFKKTRGNVYTISVFDRSSPGSPSSIPYDIQYYLDDRLIASFPSQRLPFSFSRNLIGQQPGRHLIRIDILGPDRPTRLASSEVDVEVLELKES